MSDFSDAIADEISGHPIGAGYYGTAVATDEAREIADAIFAMPEMQAIRQALRLTVGRRNVHTRSGEAQKAVLLDAGLPEHVAEWVLT